MDVLEHIDDDLGFLAQYAGKVAAGTHFLISVPAFEFLWSAHDIFLEHKRRYTLKQAQSLARQAGLEVRAGAYYFAAVFPIAATLRLAGNLLRGKDSQPRSQLTKHHPLINKILSLMCQAELSIFKHNRLAGLSIFVLARKP